MLVPVSNTYDQLNEIAKMAAEEAGAAKRKEGIRWLAGYAQSQNRKLGKAYVRFGEPFSLRKAHPRGDNQPLRWTLDKVAFEVFQRINRVTPVTAPALVTLALLGVDDHAQTLQEVLDVVEPLLAYAAQRNLPATALGGLPGATGVETVLDTLVQAGVVGRHDGGLAPVFYIEPGKHSVAAFYRNSAIHWFVNRAIVELGLMVASRDGPDHAIDRGWRQALALRDLLKFEFFFSEKPVFQEEIQAEASLLDPQMREHLAEGRATLSLLEQAPFLIAHRVLPAFLEAYFIVADRLAAVLALRGARRPARARPAGFLSHEAVDRLSTRDEWWRLLGLFRKRLLDPQPRFRVRRHLSWAAGTRYHQTLGGFTRREPGLRIAPHVAAGSESLFLAGRESRAGAH